MLGYVRSPHIHAEHPEHVGPMSHGCCRNKERNLEKTKDGDENPRFLAPKGPGYALSKLSGRHLSSDLHMPRSGITTT